jgi:3-deoxy-manno-octulosonate cytidylyltransferase (CMP-KDO synthetase)
MMTPYHIVIPSRLAAQRLPSKPLVQIAGRSLIEHVYRRACQANAESVFIATDSVEVRETAESFGAVVLMTSANHKSGSDRLAECIDIMDWPAETLLVNLQGDEPLMPAVCLDQVARLLQASPDADVASLYWPIETAEEIRNENAVKVVLGQAGHALYFSRSVIPFPRGLSLEQAIAAGLTWNRHVGLYAYRAGVLKTFSQMGPSPLESLERLEQLRFLEAGYRIAMACAADFIPPGVDTPTDLDRVRKMLVEAD